MGLLDRFRKTPEAEERQTYPLSLDEWIKYAGSNYLLSGFQQTQKGTSEQVSNDFAGLARGAMGMNGVVFACMQVRMMLLSEARFQFQRMAQGRPGDLFNSAELAPLENPWPTATTGDLITRADEDVSLAGNFFGVRLGSKIKRLRPDWVTMVLTGEAGDPETELAGVVFQPGGPGSGRDVKTYLAEQIMHFAPIPDPLASYRGMSWLTPIIREIQADNSAILHKESQFNNGATPSMIVKLDANTTEKFEAYKKAFRDNHEGAVNAGKALFLAGGTDVTVVGSNFQQMDFKALQGSAETRIAAASGVHPAIVALSEGLQGASLNAGNFTAAARLTGDKFLRPWWRNFAGSAANIINVPANARLWYDDRDIAFLQADVKDAAEVQQIQAGSIKSLIDAGFEPETIVGAIMAGDWGKLTHTGLFSVQLQPPGTGMPGTSITVGAPAPSPMPAMNGQASKREEEANTQLAFASIVAAAIERRAPDVIRVEPAKVDVHVDAAPTPNVEVHPAEVRVDVAAAPVPNVVVEAANIQVHPADIIIEPVFATPEVHVAAPEVRIEPAAVTVNIEPPEAPVVNVAVPEPRKTKRKVIRDKGGQITGMEEE